MVKTQQIILEQTRALIERIVRENMAPFGLRRVSVEPGEDHDGDPAIFVEAEYALTDEPIDTAVVVTLTTKLRDALWDIGETRFPHIQHRFAEKQRIKPRRRVSA